SAIPSSHGFTYDIPAPRHPGQFPLLLVAVVLSPVILIRTCLGYYQGPIAVVCDQPVFRFGAGFTEDQAAWLRHQLVARVFRL
ncbi:MAG: hypothetical protein ACYCW6_04435, partial [Candidatus Xenobia bacterium]